MNSSPLMSTTTPRAELGTASAIRRPGGLGDRDVELARQPRATTTSPLLLDLNANQLAHITVTSLAARAGAGG